MALNTNNNAYTIIYASVVVVIVAFLLAFVSKALEPQSTANERIDKKMQILASLNIRDIEKAEVEATYSKVIQFDEIIDSKGEIVKGGERKDKDGFLLDMKEIGENQLPLYICTIEGDTKYVFPLTGKGLWGPIWGYIALDSDLRTVFGSYFSHSGETAGLGARIDEVEFQNQFVGKLISKEGSGKIDLSLVKNGSVTDDTVECDGISGATLTGNGVDEMLKVCLGRYKNFLKLDDK